jgi:HK97 gp10 family phage protein
MTDGVEIKGLSELQKLLDTLPAKIEANIMRGAMRAGAKVVQESAKAKAPRKSGKMAEGLKITTRSRSGVVSASVKASGPHAFLAPMIEFGTKPHFISVSDENKNFNAKRGRLESVSSVNRRFLVIGGEIVGKSVSHPGSRAQPFMRPALDENTERAVVATGEYIKKRLASKHGLDVQDIQIGDE